MAGPVHAPREVPDLRAGGQVERGELELAHERPLANRAESELPQERVLLRGGVLGELARQVAQAVDEEVEIDLHALAARRSLEPRPRRADALDLLGERQPPMAEALPQAHQPLHLGGVDHRLAAGGLPEREQPDGQVGLVPPRSAADLPQVEEEAEVELPLVDVAADLALVYVEVLLRRALGVEHEGVCDEVERVKSGFIPLRPSWGTWASAGKPSARSSRSANPVP